MIRENKLVSDIKWPHHILTAAKKDIFFPQISFPFSQFDLEIGEFL